MNPFNFKTIVLCLILPLITGPSCSVEQAVDPINTQPSLSNTQAADLARYHVLLGIELFNFGLLPEAVDEFEKALALNEKFQPIYPLLAKAYLQLNQHEKLLQALSRQIHFSSNEKDVGKLYYNMGISAHKIKDGRKAIFYTMKGKKIAQKYKLDQLFKYSQNNLNIFMAHYGLNQKDIEQIILQPFIDPNTRKS